MRGGAPRLPRRGGGPAPRGPAPGPRSPRGHRPGALPPRPIARSPGRRGWPPAVAPPTATSEGQPSAADGRAPRPGSPIRPRRAARGRARSGLARPTSPRPALELRDVRHDDVRAPRAHGTSRLPARAQERRSLAGPRPGCPRRSWGLPSRATSICPVGCPRGRRWWESGGSGGAVVRRWSSAALAMRTRGRRTAPPARTVRRLFGNCSARLEAGAPPDASQSDQARVGPPLRPSVGPGARAPGSRSPSTTCARRSARGATRRRAGWARRAPRAA